MSSSDLLSVAQAIQIIDAVEVTARTMQVNLAEAQGLRLARDIVADRDYPPFDKSLMDGFAVYCRDVAAAPVELHVVGEIPAGVVPARAIGPGQAMAIMTGAALPTGADGVVPVEDCQLEQDRVRVLKVSNPARYVSRRGADCRAGQIVLERGTVLQSPQLAVAACVGTATVEVFVPPRVAMLCTGDELIPIDSEAQPAQIRNCNGVMLAALLRQMGCRVTDMGLVKDDPDAIRQRIQQTLGQFDCLVVSGGMSAGRYDFVPKILSSLGVELKISRLRIKPGRPFVFGVSGRTFVFGLPGNPVSGFVCAVRLCSRLLSRMAGGRPDERWRQARLQSPLDSNGDREFYQPAILSGQTVQPLKWKGSADIFTLAQANALIVRKEHDPARQAGEIVDVLEIL